MTMSRRDTIIIAVLINVGLLAILFVTAIDFDEDNISDQSELVEAVAEPPPSQNSYNNSASLQNISHDEVDNMLKLYSSQTQGAHPLEKEAFHPSTQSNFPATPSAKPEVSQPTQVSQENESGRYVPITVKRGDSLDKIARANGTTVKEIMKINKLTGDRIDIGQVLWVPTKSSKGQELSAPTKPSQRQENSPEGSQYYIMQHGDNPWKVAKKFQINFEDLVRLNNLDEERARNLRVGDKLRIK